MKRLSQQEFIERVEKVHGKEIQILGEYKSKREKILVKHMCGYIWYANPQSLYLGHSCPKCCGNIKKSTDIIKKEIFDIVGDEYELLGDYINSNTPILFKHNVCGNLFKMTPKAFIHRGQRCPNERYIRSSKSNIISYSKIKNEIEKIGDGKYKIVGDYIKSSEKITFFHTVCGKTFELKPTSFIKGGVRCPYCKRSKGEEVIREYLELNNIIFKEQYKIEGCKNVRPLRFDFAIFDSNDELICLIEYDGAQHFEKKFNCSEKEYLRLKENDDIKNNFCKNNNIRLIRIKYVRSSNPNIFKNKVIEKLKYEFAKNNMIIPSEAYKETLGTCND